jgi:hypothetical protein
MHGKVWGMTTIIGPPSLWVTINPADVNDPIAQVIAGVEIDLENFCKEDGPNLAQRAHVVTSDPFVAAKFFHVIIKAVLEELMGIQVPGQGVGKIKRKQGIFGRVNAYMGSMEAQGQGTLHLHLLVWLMDALSPTEMKAALATTEFREQVKNYIATVIKADIAGKTKEEINTIPKETSAAFSVPPDPRIADFEAKCTERTLALA